MPEHRVFLSYRSTDRPAVEALARRLEAHSIGVWFDQWEILGGDSITRRINEGLAGTDAALVFFSRTYMAMLLCLPQHVI